MNLQCVVSGSRFLSAVLAVSAAGLLSVGVASAADPSSQPPADTPATEQTAAGKDGKKEKEKEEKVVKGIIASQGTFGQFAGVAVETAGSSPGDEASVISGSVSYAKENVCRATISNNGEKTYSVYFAVIGTDNGKKVFSSTGSGTVKPKGTLVKEVFGCKREYNLALELRSAKALK